MFFATKTQRHEASFFVPLRLKIPLPQEDIISIKKQTPLLPY